MCIFEITSLQNEKFCWFLINDRFENYTNNTSTTNTNNSRLNSDLTIKQMPNNINEKQKQKMKKELKTNEEEK